MSGYPRLRVFLTHTEEALTAQYLEAGLEELRRVAEVVLNPTGRVLSGAGLSAAAKGCEVIIAHRATPGLAETFATAPDLVAFLRAAVDVSTIDIGAASAEGILVTRTGAAFENPVAELAFGMMIDLARGVSRMRGDYLAGRVPAPPRGIGMAGATLGIVGYGRIGRRLAAMAGGWGMRVLVHDPFASPVPPVEVAGSLEALLAAADFVVCLAVSAPGTARMFDARAFAAMRPGSCFLNLSRGELVDEDALEAALDSGHLRGAGLDVGLAPDQMPSPRFTARPDVVATPHIGGVTPEARMHQTMDTVHQVAALSAGQVPGGALNAEAAFRLAHLAGRRGGA
ncbi:NAD(P)-dependent oxidoreductase [Roseomonas populi]|uniref:Hydroxyacid dehydrogenase n=1 Tax=Roseomonas populi TaxID=3121582 RepID=A0ABT1XBD6_9PROT|nr:NAD(P)-dependent oxidoreductase [Roseomonas pecuniae]MCR0985438.1 hydroxyacid dehydrogenase [Roseomonas pecuniae]